MWTCIDFRLPTYEAPSFILKSNKNHIKSQICSMVWTAEGCVFWTTFLDIKGKRYHIFPSVYMMLEKSPDLILQCEGVIVFLHYIRKSNRCYHTQHTWMKKPCHQPMSHLCESKHDTDVSCPKEHSAGLALWTKTVSAFYMEEFPGVNTKVFPAPQLEPFQPFNQGFSLD